MPKGCYVNARRRPIVPGERSHKLTAVEAVNQRGPDGCILWRCRCDCGGEAVVAAYTLRNGRRKSCGCLGNPLIAGNSLRKGRLHFRWRGGRTLTTSGYVHIYAPEHHKHSKDNYVLEHVLVMERMLGRDLYSGENVHHKNGVKTDNRPENLELWVTKQPYGQRPSDLVRWAKEILARYDRSDTLADWSEAERRLARRDAKESLVSSDTLPIAILPRI